MYPVVKSHESPYAAFANNPIWFTDKNGNDTIVYNSKGVEIYRGTVADIRKHDRDEFGVETYWTEKVPDIHYVADKQGDVIINGMHTIRALSRESLFGDRDDKYGMNEDFYTSLDRTTINSGPKAKTLVDSYMSNNDASTWGDFFNRANDKRDYDFKRSILAGDRTSDKNVNTSYVVDIDGSQMIMNRNEAGNYLFGMGAARTGVPKSLLLLSGHAVEWINRSALSDEPSEQKALSEGYEDYNTKVGKKLQ